MPKYNKFNIGDIIGHHESPTLKFRVIDVLIGVPEKEGAYGYAYSQIFDGEETEMKEIFSTLNSGIYIEKDLFLIRKPTYYELNSLLGEALDEVERFEGLLKDIRAEMDKLKEQKG